MEIDPRALPVPAGWARHIGGWTSALRAAGRSASTIRTRVEHVQRLARELDGTPGGVTAEGIREWAGRQVWAAETRRSHYASFRSFFRWCHGAGVTNTDPAVALPSVRAGQPNPRPVPALAVTVAKARSDARVSLMLRLGDEAGLRRGEIAVVHARDVVGDLDGWTLTVHGKGGRIRYVPLTESLADALRAATRDGWAFPGRIEGHLSARRVGELLRDALPGAWTGHSLRHGFAARLDRTTGGDLAVIQDLMGHASPATTRVYIPKDLARMRAAIERASA